MRNNFPRAKVWVKLIPGRDVAEAVQVAVSGADAVTVDGAEAARAGRRRRSPGRWDARSRSACNGLRKAPCLLVSGRMSRAAGR